MRMLLVVGVVAALISPALAQKSPKPQFEIQPGVLANPRASDSTSPDAGLRWRIHPVRVGYVNFSTAPNGERHKLYRTVFISVFNPSQFADATLSLSCKPGVEFDSASKRVPKGSFLNTQTFFTNEAGGVLVAECSILADRPIVLAAYIQDTYTVQADPSNSAETRIDVRLIPWPAFRLEPLP